jgi:hypothetical protein
MVNLLFIFLIITVLATEGCTKGEVIFTKKIVSKEGRVARGRLFFQ